MANVLSREKQIACIGALAEGASIRSIERLTGVHGDTIGRLAVRIGKACAKIMDEKMRGLNCAQIQMDEIWGFVGKKQANLRPGDAAKGLGDVWTWVAVDAETRMVPCFRVGKRDSYNAKCFVGDLATRVNGRVRISTDALAAESLAVVEMFRGQKVWEGIVEAFNLVGHPRAKRAYGWGWQDCEETRYVAVLDIPPVDSANTAVRAAIAAGAQT